MGQLEPLCEAHGTPFISPGICPFCVDEQQPATPVEVVVHESRYWLAHRNGRVCAESNVPMKRGNPYRKNSPSWRAFNESYAVAIAKLQGGGEQ